MRMPHKSWWTQEMPDADIDAMKILEENIPVGGYRGVVHCFSSNVEAAKQYINMGFCLGIGGKNTLDKYEDLRNVVKQIDLENLLIETDSPYLKLKGDTGKINTPLNLFGVAEEIAQIKGRCVIEVIEQTTQNAKRVFRL